MGNRWYLYDFLGELFKLLAVMGILVFIGGIVALYYDVVGAEILFGAGMGLAIGFGLGYATIDAVQKVKEEKLMYEAQKKYLENPLPPPIFCSHCGWPNAGGSTSCSRCQSPIGHIGQRRK